MKNKDFTLGAIMLMFGLFLGNIQTTKAQEIISGDLSFLKKQTSINVVFDFTNFKLEKETEAEFLAREVADKNKKEAGSGDKFKENWINDRDVKFVEAFKKVLGERVNITVNDPNAKYTLVVCNINLTNKGWGNKISGGHPASMINDFKFVETANQNNIVCLLHEGRTQYMAMTGTLSQKVQGCLEYSTAFLAKNMKKYL
jgi:hypothetical protein